MLRTWSPGGFIEIAQYAKKVVFCGTFDAQGSRLAWSDGRLTVLQAGKVRKFVEHVERITFAAAYARRTGQEVLYITERAVFRLVEQGLELIEVAPGIRSGTRHSTVHGLPAEHRFGYGDAARGPRGIGLKAYLEPRSRNARQSNLPQPSTRETTESPKIGADAAAVFDCEEYCLRKDGRREFLRM